MEIKAILEWENRVLNKYILKNGLLSIDESKRKVMHEWLHSNDSNKYNKRLIRLTVPMVLTLAESWYERMQKRICVKDENDIDIKTILNSGKYTWVELKTQEAYHREGFKMKHCVNSYASKPFCTILSLRDNQNNPHCTVEIEDGIYDPTMETTVFRINQIAGKMNRPAPKKYRQALIDIISLYISKGYTIEPKLYLHHSFILYKKELTDISTLKEVEGDLDLRNFTGEMPKKLIINGNLFLNDANPRKLSNHLKVSGKIFISKNFSIPPKWNSNKFVISELHIEPSPI